MFVTIFSLCCVALALALPFIFIAYQKPITKSFVRLGWANEESIGENEKK